MKKIYALSFSRYKEILEQHKVSDQTVSGQNTAFIQICGTKDVDMCFVLNKSPNVLCLSFDDVDEIQEVPVLYPDGTTHEKVYPMNKEQARQIVDFVKQNEDKETFIVHCRAGQSRSGGVAKFIAEYFGITEREFYWFNPRTTPNRRIIRMLHEINQIFG